MCDQPSPSVIYLLLKFKNRSASITTVQKVMMKPTRIPGAQDKPHSKAVDLPKEAHTRRETCRVLNFMHRGTV